MLKSSDILYNPFKHHLSYVNEIISQSESINTLLPIIKTLGSSKMDLYYGKTSVSDLFDQIITLIPANNESDFKQWVTSPDGFQIVNILDNSDWILRHSSENQFIHIHPGRYTAHTLRVSANVFKTAAIAVAAMQSDQIKELNTKTINDLRTSFLGLSPISNLNKSDQINLIVNLLIQNA